MKKALMLASVASMIDLFNRDNLDILTSLGFHVDVACNFDNGSITSQEKVDTFKRELIDSDYQVHNLPIPRSITKLKKIYQSYKIVNKLCQTNNYEIVHCHSPIGGFIARLACKKARKKGTKVIYTAHGFHFYKGAPIKNWIIYYTIEKMLSKFTDTIITMNIEDYQNAKRFSTKNTIYIPGIGIDVDLIKNTVINKSSKRKQLGLTDEDFVFISIGQLSVRKNHEVIIKALSLVTNDSIKLIICGLGELESYLQKLVNDLGLKKRVIFTGYRSDVYELLHMSDAFIFPSLQEGLPVSLMEAMAVGLPVVCSRIRGNIDLIQDGINGLLMNPKDIEATSKNINLIYKDKIIRQKMSENNIKIINNYDKNIIRFEMLKLYKQYNL
ncbi:glycosyltransferase family 4 protein [Peloplasma aerotolerans]|uniref:Glycosyltransferase family 4 protein n=1 Tax=Peloplasma aerotolerans TaxID=3044389 RepID=A0AAW6U3D5_9MOLU|nr:glycosyltransferase family 4 protein [Mariniplasma sp. M4Ah]MDI6452377.1 glycosyltransferase family 4 protein [Mariniplasma sp. M4Ah]